MFRRRKYIFRYLKISSKCILSDFQILAKSFARELKSLTRDPQLEFGGRIGLKVAYGQTVSPTLWMQWPKTIYPKYIMKYRGFSPRRGIRKVRFGPGGQLLGSRDRFWPNTYNLLQFNARKCDRRVLISLRNSGGALNGSGCIFRNIFGIENT